jgi:hypothetical protein
VRTFKDSLKNNSWNEARVLLRFIGDLVNCHVVSANSFIQLMGSLLDVTKEDEVPYVRKDWYVFNIQLNIIIIIEHFFFFTGTVMLLYHVYHGLAKNYMRKENLLLSLF